MKILLAGFLALGLVGTSYGWAVYNNTPYIVDVFYHDALSPSGYNSLTVYEGETRHNISYKSVMNVCVAGQCKKRSFKMHGENHYISAYHGDSTCDEKHHGYHAVKISTKLDGQRACYVFVN